jgi:GAF domain-containing protein
MIRDLAAQISKGDYHVRLDQDQKDDLGKVAVSLNSMAESLQYSFALLEDKEWLQSGIASLNDQMVGEKSVPELANDILESIVAHTRSHVAAFYLLEDEIQLELIAGYALLNQEKRSLLKEGEGLAGQAWKSAKQILINDIPDEELTISYAAGNTRPKNVVAVPVFRNEQVVGVIELGSLNTFTPLQLEFLHNISVNIGIAIHVSQNRKKLQEFLEETQAQA